MIQAAIVDVDGVLLDSMGIWKDLGRRYLQTRGKQAKEDLDRVLYPMTLDQSSHYLRVHYGLAEGEDAIIRGIKGLLHDFYCHEVKEKRGAKDLLRFFQKQGIPFVLASTSSREELEAAFRRLQLPGRELLLTAKDVGLGKQEPIFFCKLAGELGVKSENCLVVEDALYAIRAAKRAGCLVAAMEDCSTGKEEREIQTMADGYYHDPCGLLRDLQEGKLG